MDTLIEKYAKGEERTEDDIFLRVARGVAQTEAPAEREAYAERFDENMKAGGQEEPERLASSSPAN